jgi:hypothetical protein
MAKEYVVNLKNPEDSPEKIAEKLNTLTYAIDGTVIRGLTPRAEFDEFKKNTTKYIENEQGRIQANGQRGKLTDMRYHGAGLSSVEHDSTLTGEGTVKSPLSVAPAPGADEITLMQLLGSSYKAMTAGLGFGEISNASVLADGQNRLIPVYLSTAQTITGVTWYQKVKGSYTADNNNKIGLYSYSGGTLTLVASCANDGTLWSTATSETFGTKAFSSTYAASAGLYFIALLYNMSAEVTAPQLGVGPGLTNAGVNVFDFTNSAKYLPTLTAQTDLSSSFTMASASSAGQRYWVALY